MNDQCPVCRSSYARILHEADYGAKKTYECAVCGRFTISDTMQAIRANEPADPRLSAWIRSQEEEGLVPPTLLDVNVANIRANLPQYKPLQKQLLLLRSIERRTRYPGYEVALNPDTDYSLAWADCSEELDYLLRSLAERKLIYLTQREGSHAAVIRAEGWEHLDRHETEAAIADQAFVAMSFSDALKPAWETGIMLAIEDAGYRPFRVDKELHIDRIDAKIEVEIRNSRFLVADVTEGKKGVYFEAGFALGLGKPVVWSVRKDALDHDVHFDTRQYRHIVWESPDELKRELFELICAVVGRRKRTRVGADS